MFIHRLPQYLFVSTLIVSALTIVIMSGCTPFEVQRDDSTSNQGGGEGALQMPFQSGRESICTQGAHGSHSHSSTSTEYDIDLDTDNYSDEEIYAPISGTAHVHLDATSGFGYHVNIDLGNGTYIVLGHFANIFVGDGDEIAAGQLLGTRETQVPQARSHPHRVA